MGPAIAGFAAIGRLVIDQLGAAQRGKIMATRDDLKVWVVEALNAHGGSAHIVDVAKHIWTNHRAQLETSGSLLYTWQYDARWAADSLRKAGVLLPKPKGDRGPWTLARP
jgi:hypothetical protein